MCTKIFADMHYVQCVYEYINIPSVLPIKPKVSNLTQFLTSNLSALQEGSSTSMFASFCQNLFFGFLRKELLRFHVKLGKLVLNLPWYRLCYRKQWASYLPPIGKIWARTALAFCKMFAGHSHITVAVAYTNTWIHNPKLSYEQHKLWHAQFSDYEIDNFCRKKVFQNRHRLGAYYVC